MRSIPGLAAAASLAALVIACAPAPSFTGPVGRVVAEQALSHDVPADLMAAIAHVEGGLFLSQVREVEDDDAIPVAGVLELRHGRFNSLARGAALMGVSEKVLERDLSAGTEAGARVLADLAAQYSVNRHDLAAWAPVVEELSGHLLEKDRIDYRARVFAVLRAGGPLPARGGETLVIAAHPELSIDLTIPPPSFEPQDTPEYAGAKWFPTPQDNKWTPGRDGNPVTMIAIHDTEGGWDASVSTLQNDGGKSVHYIIDADGSRVGQFIHEGDTGWHAGNWYYNQHMVGIEHVGYAGKDDYQTALYEGSAKLVRDIAKRQKLGPNGDGTHLDRSILVGHQEVPDGGVIAEDSPPCSDSPGTCVKSPNYGGANNHRDPGVNWEWCQYMEIVGEGASCKCNDAFDLWNCVHDSSEAFKCPDGKLEVLHCANNSCIVEPNGTDDHCGTVDPTTTSGAGAGTGTGTGVGGSIGVAAGGDGGQGGAGGAGTTGSGAAGASKNSSVHGGCSLPSAPADGEGALSTLALAAIATLLTRRRKSSAAA